MSITLPYNYAEDHKMIFDNQAKQFIETIKNSGIVQLELLTKSEGEPITASQWQELYKFVESYVEDYKGPALIFSKIALEGRMQMLKKLADKFDINFLLPLKAIQDKNILLMANKYFSGFDVSNEKEYDYLPANLQNKLVFVTSPIFPPSLSYYLKKNNTLCVTVDDISQFEQLENFDTSLEYCIRLNASTLLEDYYQALKGVIESPTLSRFGVSNKDDLVKMLQSKRHRFKGFHIHAGKETGNIPHTYIELAAQSLKLAHSLQIELQYLNLGGGLLYLSNEELETLISALKKMLPQNTKCFFEPGRFLTRGCGYALGRVASIINRGAFIDIALDLSSQCHLKWSEPKLIIAENSETLAPIAKHVRIFGSTCAEPDYLGDFMLAPSMLNNLRRDSILLFGDIMGYSASWNTQFNGIPPAQTIYL